MTANPYAVYMDADAKAEPIDPRRAFENHTAYEIALLNEFCEVNRSINGYKEPQREAAREEMAKKHVPDKAVHSMIPYSDT